MRSENCEIWPDYNTARPKSEFGPDPSSVGAVYDRAFFLESTKNARS